MSRMSICLAIVLAVSAGAAHAAKFTPVNQAGSLAYTPVCAKMSDAASEQNSGASMKMRLAFVCHCCAWQNWGGHNVCVHQCCN
jgi:hypothetical protein